VLHLPERQFQLKVRSMVGLVPLFAVATLEPEILEKLPAFRKRMDWFIQNRPDLTGNIACMQTEGVCARRLLAIVDPDKLPRVLTKLLDESEFLSPYGIRALSRYHAQHPYLFEVNGTPFRVDYEPAESSSGLFGGNSNWRGPIWFPVNFLLIESLQTFHGYLGDSFQVPCPAGSDHRLNLEQVAAELSHRLTQIFLKDVTGQRPVYGEHSLFQQNPHWQNLILFFEYFHGDHGSGVGASHQTGWTGLVAQLIQQSKI
jgi:Glycosyl hydrolase family 63 C-terminal domain